MARSSRRRATVASAEAAAVLRDLIDAPAVYHALHAAGLIRRSGPKPKKPPETLAYKVVKAYLHALEKGRPGARVTAAGRLMGLLNQVTASGLAEPGVRDPETDHFIRDDELTDLDACRAVQRAYGMHTRDNDDQAAERDDA